MLLGCFVENNARSGYLEGAIRQAVECDANCFMFYLGSPQTTIRAGIDKFNIPEFKNELKENKIDIEHVFVHAPYIINPASNDPKKQKFAVSFLTEECLRCEKIGVKYLILHPGNAIENIGLDTAISNCANIINKIHKKTSVAICIETMSGKGSEIGRDFKEIKRIIDLVEEKDKIGVCLDTCHVWDSGYDLGKPDKIIDEFDKIIGLNYLKVIHVNDSMSIRGAKKDRHENIGYGQIGYERIVNFIYHKKLENICKILETPIYWTDLCYTYSSEIKNIKRKAFHDWIKVPFFELHKEEKA